MLLSLKLCVAASAGLASHNGLFIHGEWHLQAPVLLRIFLVLAFATHIAEAGLEHAGSLQAFKTALLLITAYSTALFGSMIIYRTIFHRLRKFPGPLLARTTKFWHVLHCLNSQNHLLMDGLHQQYGDFVRTGPDELTIFNPEIMAAFDGRVSKCSKSVWYDFLWPMVGLNTTRDKALHDKRRRIWDQAFTTKALLNYEDRVQKYTRQLERCIASAGGDPINVTSWFYWFSFDIMGDFAFAKSFNMLSDQKWHDAITLLRNGMALLGPLTAVPWLAQIAFSIPGFWIVRDWKKMTSFAETSMRERIATKVDKPDVSHYLIEASRQSNSLEADMDLLNGDAVAMIVAGSDTVALTLVYALYRLSAHPEHAEQIRGELSGIGNILDPRALQYLPHLNGCINETLRLHPPVPTGGLRESPSEGITVAGQYIPGNVTLCAPRYTLGRLESCFERAAEFVPERWYSEPHMVRDKRAFAPFSVGQYYCIGKSLATTELRLVIAMLVLTYDVAFAPGEDGTDAVRNMKDQFTATPGKLMLTFKKRREALA